MTDDYGSLIERAQQLRDIVESARCQVGELDDLLALTAHVADAWIAAWEAIDRAIVLATVRRYPVSRVRAARRRMVDAMAIWQLVHIGEERYGIAVVNTGPLLEAITALHASRPARVVRVGKRRSLWWLPLVFAGVSVAAWLFYDAVDQRAVPMVSR
jgi:hypothetical protein